MHGHQTVYYLSVLNLQIRKFFYLVMTALLLTSCTYYDVRISCHCSKGGKERNCDKLKKINEEQLKSLWYCTCKPDDDFTI